MMFRHLNRVRVAPRFQRRNISFQSIKTRIEENALFQRIAKPFNNVYFRRSLRVVQVGVLTFMVYQAGYQRGVVNYSKNPEKFEEDMMKWVLGAGGTNDEFIIYNHRSEQYVRVHRVVTRIIASARDFCASQHLDAQRRVGAAATKCLGENTPENRAILQAAQEELDYWALANTKMQVKWDVVVSDHAMPNAFVTGFCPRKIFVYEGLLKSVNPNDDELAVILGHEISHVILGHTDEEMPSTAIVLGLELIIMSLVDPIGIWTFMFDIYLNKLRNYITATYSRAHEEEADELGLEIASLACFNVAKGANVFKKLSDLDRRKTTSWTDTHPASIERYGKLSLQSKKYEGKDNVYVERCAQLQNAGVLSGLYKFMGA